MARTRRVVLFTGLVAALAFGALFAHRSADAQSGPIKVGLIYPTTGFAANIAKPLIQGHEVAVAEINERGGVLGRKIELIIKDDRANAEVGTRAATELIQRDKVDFLMGTLTSNVAVAVSELARTNKIPLIATFAKTDILTAEKGHRYISRVATTTIVEGRALAELEKDAPGTRYYTMAFDYEYGRRVIEAFTAHLKKVKPKAEIVGQAWPKLGETEWTSQVTAAMAAKPDVIVSFVFGDAFIALVKQAKPYGFFDKMRVITGAEEVSTEAPIMGKELPAGLLGNSYDLPNAPATPEHKRWVDSFLKRTGEKSLPGSAIQGYIGTQFLAEAIKKAGSADREAVTTALEGLTVNTPIGPLTMRAYDRQVNRGQMWGVTEHTTEAPFVQIKNARYVSADGLLPTVEEIKQARGGK